MFDPKLKISKSLMEKLKIASEISGSSSVEELAIKILEEQADKIINVAGKGAVTQDVVDDITNKLKGLGYLE